MLAKEKGAIKRVTTVLSREEGAMKKIMFGLMVAVSLFFVSDCLAQELLVAIRQGDTVWTKTCQTCPWTQVPGNLKTPTVVWEAGLNRFVLYGTRTGGQIWRCTFDRGGQFQNDWVQVEGSALEITGASVVGGNLERLALLRWYGVNQAANVFATRQGAYGIAFDGSSIWVTSSSRVANLYESYLTKLRASDGTTLGSFKVGDGPGELAFDGRFIWVTNYNSDTVSSVYASTGQVLGTYRVGRNPTGIAFDGTNMWVTNYNGQSCTKLAASGDILATYTFLTAPGGNPPYPRRIAFDGTYIRVTRAGQNTVSKLRTSDGATLGTFPTGSGPYGIAFDGANIWVANYTGNTVTKLRASDGVTLGTFSTGSHPHSIAFDGANIWVTNQGSSNLTDRVCGTVTKLRASDGANLATFTFPEHVVSGLPCRPTGIAFRWGQYLGDRLFKQRCT